MTMITKDDIKDVLKKYSEQTDYFVSRSWGNDMKFGNIVKEEDYEQIADELYKKVFGKFIENIKLKAELEIYRTVMGNSNFKMVAEKIKESKNV